ncbi:hypothetical protein DXG03_004104 [Asterophora parasitica]|uniref:Uncharacterized protein n=1 Tax=Asterophora parasitica TaxID=117018 RepID=A0A9P7G6X1_9AGAR|nr:hypothetical protein DXG03_004104 [Asterophora parasitica]
MSATFTTTARSGTTSDLHRRRAKRRLSTPSSSKQPARLICRPLPLSLEALDLSSASPTQTLASLRFLVLSYLAELEQRLSNLESPDLEAWKAMGELTIEDARQWAQTALEMLEGIRADVCSHLPDFHFADMSVENFVNHLPDLPDVPGLNEMRSHLPDMQDMRSHLPDMPNLPDMPDVRSHLSDMRLKLDDVRSRFHDLDFKKPLSYIPTLSDHLENLHSHLSTMELPSPLEMSDLAPSAMISDLLEAFLSSELVTELLSASATEIVEETEDMLHRAANDVANAVKRSLQGVRLIQYSDLPHQWRNNPFVTHGYRQFYRIGFFLSLAFSALAPLASLSIVHSWREMTVFVAPIVPSLLSYIIGLIFYALHFPERILPPSVQSRLDCIGGGSHCIWHCFIVLAVSQHRAAIASLREGVQCLAP